MSKAHSNEETLKEIESQYKSLMRECFKDGIIGDSQPAYSQAACAKYGFSSPKNNGQTCYDQAIRLFDEIKDELDSEGMGYLVNFQHNKNAHNNKQGERYEEFATLIGKVHAKILRNADSCCYDVINQWNGISNSINNKDDGSAITVNGKYNEYANYEYTETSANGISQTKKGTNVKKMTGQVGLLDYLTNNLNGFDKAMTKFREFEMQKIVQIEARLGKTLYKERAHLMETSYLNKDIQEVNRLMSSEDKMKTFVIEGIYIATLITVGIATAAVTGGISLVGVGYAIAATTGVGIGAGALKSAAYTYGGKREGFALDGENNYGNNVESRYMRMMAEGAIDFGLVGAGGALGSMRNLSGIGRKSNFILKEFGADIGEGFYEMSKKENRTDFGDGKYGTWGLNVLGGIVLGKAVEVSAKDNLNVFKKPTSGASKDHILGTDDFKTYTRDVAFKDGKQVAYGQGKAADGYIDGHAVEVMNYDLSDVKGHESLKKEIIEEYSARKADFPEGTKQTYIIDARRQTELSQLEEDALKAEIWARTGTTENELEIRFEFK